MRKVVDPDRLKQFMRSLGRAARSSGRVYFTGGATALLLGWRSTTVDVDLKMEPEQDALFRSLPEIKENLEINVEIACPSDFIPELRGWRERSLYIGQEGKLSFYHYDLYAQALSKIERGHAQDLEDVREMIEKKWIAAEELRKYFEEIEPRLYRYPAIDPRSFRRAVREISPEAGRGRPE